jgi:hypothetical protein
MNECGLRNNAAEREEYDAEVKTSSSGCRGGGRHLGEMRAEAADYS